MDIILYILELCSYFSIFSLLLQLKITTNKFLISTAFFIGTIWLFHFIYIPFIFPDIFIVFMVILLIYKENFCLKLCCLLICFLTENIISSSILQLYCCFTNADITKTYINIFEKIDCVIFLCYIFFSAFWYKKQKLSFQYITNITKKEYYLIIIPESVSLATNYFV